MGGRPALGAGRSRPTNTLDTGRLHEQSVYAYLNEILALTDHSTVSAALRADFFTFDFRGQLADSAGVFGPLRGRVNAARFATTSQLRGEAQPVTELSFTPDTPFYPKLNGSLFF